MKSHFTMAEGFGCTNYPRSYFAVWRLTLIGSPKGNWSYVKGKFQKDSDGG